MNPAAGSSEGPPDEPVSDRILSVNVSLPETLIEQVKRLTGPGSLSHYVRDAVELQVQHDELARWLAETADEHGPIPQETADEVTETWRELEDRFRREGY